MRASVAYLPGRWAALVVADVCLIADLDPTGPQMASCWDALRDGAGVDAVLGVLAQSPVSFALAHRSAAGGRLVVAGSAQAGVHVPGAQLPMPVAADAGGPWRDEALDTRADVRLIAATEQLPEQSPALPILDGVVLASCVLLRVDATGDAVPLGWVAPEPDPSPAFVVEALNPLPEPDRSGSIPALPWRTPDPYGWEYSQERPSYADAGPTVASVPVTPDPPAPAAGGPPYVPPPAVPVPSTLVRAVQCANGHLNPPYPGSCRLCGVPLAAQEPFTVERPSLGALVLSTGPVVELDRDVLLGRAPFAVNEEGTRLVPLSSPDNDISRNHVRVSLDGWWVQVVDLASTNGTIVTLPGQPPVRLRPHDPFTIVAGTSVMIADEVGVRYEVSS